MGARGHRFLVLAVASVILAACAETSGQPSKEPPGEAPATNRYGANATVLDDGGGPELCLGAVAESLPPQCGGMPILGWRWEDVDGEQTRGSVTWGDYHVVGTYDGSAFTVESAGPIVPTEPGEGNPFESPCSEPEGGWTDVDPSRTSDDDRIAAMHEAEDVPEYAGIWISYLQEPVDFEIPGPYVLNAAFTGDPHRFESALRGVWGGPLCLLSFDRTHRELVRVQRELEGVADSMGFELLWSSVDVIDNEVELGIVVAEPRIEAALAEAYGEGTVRIVPALQPV
jgi:hypothetical protein